MLATRSPTPMRTTEPVSLKVSDSDMSMRLLHSQRTLFCERCRIRALLSVLISHE